MYSLLSKPIQEFYIRSLPFPSPVPSLPLSCTSCLEICFCSVCLDVFLCVHCLVKGVTPMYTDMLAPL